MTKESKINFKIILENKRERNLKQILKEEMAPSKMLKKQPEYQERIMKRMEAQKL